VTHFKIAGIANIISIAIILLALIPRVIILRERFNTFHAFAITLTVMCLVRFRLPVAAAITTIPTFSASALKYLAKVCRCLSHLLHCDCTCSCTQAESGPQKFNLFRLGGLPLGPRVHMISYRSLMGWPAHVQFIGCTSFIIAEGAYRIPYAAIHCMIVAGSASFNMGLDWMAFKWVRTLTSILFVAATCLSRPFSCHRGRQRRVPFPPHRDSRPRCGRHTYIVLVSVGRGSTNRQLSCIRYVSRLSN
jgi:hypothetical protein